MATLDTTGGTLEIEGFVPKVAVLDSGAGGLILGKSFAKQIDLCHEGLLTPAGAFLTPTGELITGVKKTVNTLSFVLAKGTVGEIRITAEVLISETDVYDVLLGMDFLGATFGFVHPLTSDFIWYTDCKEIGLTYLPHKTAALPVNTRGGVRQHKRLFMFGEITCAEDLLDAVQGDEEAILPVATVMAMAGVVTDPAPMLVSPTLSDDARFQSSQATKTRQIDTARNAEAVARLLASKTRKLPTQYPTSEWIGNDWAVRTR